MTYDQFISRFERTTKTARGLMTRCPAHEDGTASLSIGRSQKGGVILKCFAGCTANAIVAALGLSLKDLFAEEPAKQFNPPKSKVVTTNGEKPVIEKIYSYHDENDQELYQVVRLKPKDFRQRHSVDGKWIWSMENVQRVLYRLPQLKQFEEVWIVEGERDVDNLWSIGIPGTTNVGGAGKWLDGYTESLSGKNLVICGDNDEPGRKHVEMVFGSISQKAKTVRKIQLPEMFKDVSDFIASFSTQESAKRALEQLRDDTPPFVMGKKLPLFSMRDLERRYIRFVQDLSNNSLDLGKWLPTLGRLRPLVPGELAFIIGDTGIGKSSLLQTIANKCRPLPTLFFELELPPELMFERELASVAGFTCREIEGGYRSGDTGLSGSLDTAFKNLLFCTESKLSVKEIECYIRHSEMLFGEKCKLVLIDYIQLMGGEGENRRERISDIAEGLKNLAKITQTIIIVASQVGRPDKKSEQKLTLYSAKESGCLSVETTQVLTDYGYEKNLMRKMKTHTLKCDGEITTEESNGVDSGIKHCMRIYLRSGRFIDCTPEHKILTDKGWVEADKINREHAVATVRTFKSPARTSEIKQSRFMGWMIGDGSMLYRLASFTSADRALSEEFIKEVKNVFGVDVHRRKLASHLTHDEFYLSNRGAPHNPISHFLKDAGMWGFKSYEKRIPKWFLKKASNNSIAELVGGLIDTDGSVKKFRGGRKNIKFCTSSYGLLWDFVYCLSRLGIYSRIRLPEIKKGPNYNRVTRKYVSSNRPIYSALIDDSRDVEKFSKLISLRHARKKERLTDFKRAKKPSNYGDNFGIWVWKALSEQAKKEGKWNKKYRMGIYQDRRMSQERLKKELKELENPPTELSRLVNKNIYWDRLCDSEMIGRRKVFDRTVHRQNPNFVANGVIVHNSIEASCGLLLAAWRDGENTMKIKVLKCTKGGAGTEVVCNFDGERMRITERAEVEK